MTEVSTVQPTPAGADDWKSRLNLPAKDTRVQTEVSFGVDACAAEIDACAAESSSAGMGGAQEPVCVKRIIMNNREVTGA